MAKQVIGEFKLNKKSPSDQKKDVRFQDAVCHTPEMPLFGSRPGRPPIYPVVAYECESPVQADSRLGGQEPGYVYQRNGHPNAASLAEKCKQLHRADQAVIANSGQSVAALAMISQLKSGDHVVLSNRLYGGTSHMFGSQAERLGVTSTRVEVTDLDAVRNAMRPETKMVVIETISNPLLRVADLEVIAEITHSGSHPTGTVLLVDNTFASPMMCRPLEFGADLVIESMTKIMNGHGDVVAGLLCGKDSVWKDTTELLALWGWTSSAMDCWMVDRGLATLFVRQKVACENANQLAHSVGQFAGVDRVDYPGLESHPDFDLAGKLFTNTATGNVPLYGTMVSIHLAGGANAAKDFIQRVEHIPFCPTLGELHTTLSHPASTSHRGLTAEQRAELGISDGTIRLSIGLESVEFIESAIRQALG